MFGTIAAIISGISMTLQGIFNTKLNEKIGIWETTTLIQGIAFACSFLIAFFFGKGNYHNIKDANKIYLIGGVLGVVITFTVIKSVSLMGATVGIGIILIAQLLSAALINAFGLFGSEKISFTFNNFIGITLVIIGIIIFQWKK